MLAILTGLASIGSRLIVNESQNFNTYLSRKVFRWGSVISEPAMAVKNGIGTLHSKIFSLVNFGRAEISRSAEQN